MSREDAFGDAEEEGTGGDGGDGDGGGGAGCLLGGLLKSNRAQHTYARAHAASESRL